MNLNLTGKTALVTASSGGIGEAIAASLAAEGARVVINGRTQTSVDASIARLRAAGLATAELVGLATDNGTAEGCEATIAAFPEVDILVNNLGVYEAVPFFDETDEAWQRLFEINVMSGVRLSRHYLRGMIDRGAGRVVFISSESGVVAQPLMTHYSATKAMQISIGRALAEVAKGTAVTVNTVLPGPTRTVGVEAFMQSVFPDVAPDELERRYMAQYVPESLLGRLIDPREVADVVAFLCSPRAAAITGSCVRTEGGMIRTAI